MDILLCLYSVQSDSGCPARALRRRVSFPLSLGSTRASSSLAPCLGGASGLERQGKVLCSYFGKNLGLFGRLCPCLGIRSVAKVAGNEQEARWAAQMLCQGIPVPGAARVAAGFTAGRCEWRMQGACLLLQGFLGRCLVQQPANRKVHQKSAGCTKPHLGFNS